MKIRQQKQIRAFLLEAFGESEGNTLSARQEEAFCALLGQMKNASRSQRKTLAQTILPRIALYQTLLGSGLSKEDATARMRRYMMDVVGAEKHASTARMEAIPGFYALYSRVFLRVVRTTDLWESEQTHDKDHFDVTIRKCLWHTACVENGCAELCPLFCEVDNVNYGGLKKLGFSRTKTLGCGGDCCDFHFYRK